MPSSNPSPKQYRFDIERSDSNSWFHLVLVPQYSPPDPRSSVQLSRDGLPGDYKVTFILGIPGKETFKVNLDWENIFESGESLLIVAATDFSIEWRHKDPDLRATIVFFTNPKKELSKAQVRLPASNAAGATRVAHDIILPLLSWFSFRYDVAIDISAYEVIEEETEVIHINAGVLGNAKIASINADTPGFFVTPSYRNLFSAYREGANATNCFYQVLCFYKVVEGVKRIRDVRRKSALDNGLQWRAPEERIPSILQDVPVADDTERAQFQSFLGQKFNSVIDSYRELMRNTIAHLDPLSDSLSADKFEDVSKCMNAIPVIKYLARKMLKNEIAADPACEGANII